MPKSSSALTQGKSSGPIDSIGRGGGVFDREPQKAVGNSQAIAYLFGDRSSSGRGEIPRSAVTARDPGWNGFPKSPG